MKILFISLLWLFSIPVARAQQQRSDDEWVAILLVGKKFPGDHEVIASLGINSIDSLMLRLRDESHQNSLPRYSYLIGVKYRQFSEKLTPEKRSQILIPLCSKIKAIKDEGTSSYLIQSSIGSLHGIDHPALRELVELYIQSDIDSTREAARSLKGSFNKSSLSGSISPSEKRTPSQGVHHARPVSETAESATTLKCFPFLVAIAVAILACILGVAMCRRK